jgi:hypothetical protein
MAEALRSVGRETAVVNLLNAGPYPEGVPELRPLRLALQALHDTATGILAKYGFGDSDVSTIELHATPPPWDRAGYSLHTRAVIVTPEGRCFDSGWIDGLA